MLDGTPGHHEPPVVPGQETERKGDYQQRRNNEPLGAPVMMIRVPARQSFDPVTPENGSNTQDRSNGCNGSFESYQELRRPHFPPSDSWLAGH